MTFLFEAVNLASKDWQTKSGLFGTWLNSETRNFKSKIDRMIADLKQFSHLNKLNHCLNFSEGFNNLY